MSLSSPPYTNFAIHFAVWVLPVPLAPTNKKLPTGFLESWRPDFDLRIDSEISLIESFWPIIFLFKFLAKERSFEDSFVDIWVTGTPVLAETTSNISFLVTCILDFIVFLAHFSITLSYSSSKNICSSSIISLEAPIISTLASLMLKSCNFFSISLAASGLWMFFILTLDPAWSMTSIALSGNCLSIMYLDVNSIIKSRVSSG